MELGMSARARFQKYLDIDRIKKLHDSVHDAFMERGPLAHNWDHVYRDTINAVWIGEAEGADMDIVLPAILLHDIGFLYDPNPLHHHVVGSEKCHEWLFEWSDEDKAKIAGCIKSHKGKYPGFDFEPESIEARVVHDADLIEKAGWIGILQGVRTFAEFGETGLDKYKDCRTLHGIVNRIARFKTATFYTKTGETLAAERGGFDLRRQLLDKALVELERYEE